MQPDPMPVFVVKGKDFLAPGTVEAYRDMCVDAGLANQAREVALAHEEIMQWQTRNPHRLRWPAHEHVPVTTKATRTKDGHLTCGFGRCEQPIGGALMVQVGEGASSDAEIDNRRTGVLLLCEQHWGTPPDKWTD